MGCPYSLDARTAGESECTHSHRRGVNEERWNTRDKMREAWHLASLVQLTRLLLLKSLCQKDQNDERNEKEKSEERNTPRRKEDGRGEVDDALTWERRREFSDQLR